MDGELSFEGMPKVVGIFIVGLVVVAIAVIVLTNVGDNFNLTTYEVNVTNYSLNFVSPYNVTTLSYFFSSGGGDNSSTNFGLWNDSNVINAYLTFTGLEVSHWYELDPLINLATGAAGTYNQIVVTDDALTDETYVFYRDVTAGTVNVAITQDANGSAAWVNATVNDSSSGLGISATYDDQNDLYFVAYKNSSNVVAVASGGTWTWNHAATEPSPTGENCGDETSIEATDTDGYVGVAYRCSTNTDLKFAEWDTGLWTYAHVDNESNTGRNPSLVWDSAEAGWDIFYIDGTDQLLRHANGSMASGWNFENLTAIGGVATTTLSDVSASICNNQFVVTWMNETGGVDFSLYVANGTEGSWTTNSMLPSVSNVHHHDSVCYGDTVRVAYSTSATIGLYYFDYNLSSGVATTPLELFNDTAQLGNYVSIALDRFENNPRISFDANNGTQTQLDFVWVNRSYPADVCLDIGGTGACDYLSAGTLNTAATTANLSTALTSYLTGACASAFCEVPLELNSSAEGEVEMSAITILYNRTVNTTSYSNSEAEEVVYASRGALGDFATFGTIIGIVIAAVIIIGTMYFFKGKFKSR